MAFSMDGNKHTHTPFVFVQDLTLMFLQDTGPRFNRDAVI